MYGESASVSGAENNFIPAFKKADLAVYAALFLLIAALFIFLKPSAGEELRSVELYLSGTHGSAGRSVTGARRIIFDYDFSTGKYRVYNGFEQSVKVERENGALLVTAYISGGFNTVKILYSGEAYMLDANCSAHKDCVRFAHIARGGMSIVCVPHGLTVIGVGANGAQPPEPVTG